MPELTPGVKSLLNLGKLYDVRREFFITPQVTRELFTDVSPFVTFVSSRGITQTPDPDFKMFEHRSGWINQKCTVTISGGVGWEEGGGVPGALCVGIVVETVSGLPSKVDNSWLGLVVEIYDADNETYKGVARIYAVVAGDVGSTGKITLQALGNPQDDENACGDLVTGDNLQVIGTAFGEGTEAPDGWSDELEVVYNSTQIFKTAVEVTGTLYEAALRGYSDELARLRIDKNREHKIQKERAFLLGVRAGGIGMAESDSHAYHETDAEGHMVRTTMGVLPTIWRYGHTTGDDKNIFTITVGAYTYDNFVDDTEQLFRYIPTSGEKDAFCGAGFLSFFSKTGEGTFITNSGFNVQLMATQRDALGFNFRRLETPHGAIRLIPTPVLRGPYRNTAVIVDPDDLKYVQYRPSKFLANIKTENAWDGVKDMWFSDEGIGMTLVEKHAVMQIVSA